MNNNERANRDILIARVKRNYAKYEKETIELDGEEIFDMAEEIAEHNHVYDEIMSGDYLSESDAVFLLQFVNPLKVLAQEWSNYILNYNDDFDAFLDEFIGCGDTGYHMTIKETKKLCEKHRTDDDLEAYLAELIEAAKAYLYGEGAEFCGKP